MIRLCVFSIFLVLASLLYSPSAQGQEGHYALLLPLLTPSPPSIGLGTPQLSVPLLTGSPAPFDGLLIDETSAIQCIEDAASVDRLTVELAARNRELEVSTRLREDFERDQASRIAELSQTSWWDENGAIFMLGVGLVLGVAGSALVVGLAN